MTYHLHSDDWPTRGHGLTPDQIDDTLDGMDEYAGPAIESLRESAREGLAELDRQARKAP